MVLAVVVILCVCGATVAVAGNGLVVNAGFETTEITGGGWPSEYGDWRGDHSYIVGTHLGVEPREGTKMLKFGATSFTGDYGASVRCDVFQIIDISGFSDAILAGEATASASVYFNRVMGDANTDTEFDLEILAYPGDPCSFPTYQETGGMELAAANSLILTDGNEATWQQCEAELLLPTDTNFVIIGIRAVENIVNDESTTEFDGHFADDVSLSISTGPPPVPMGDVYYVDGVNGSDLYDGLSLGTAFATIQKGIGAANDGNTVLVYPAVYSELVDFYGKAITVQGVATAGGIAVIEAPGDYAVSFFTDEGPDSVLKNFVIRNSFMGVFVADAFPTLQNLTIVNNDWGVAAYGGADPDISSCIFHNNSEGHLYGCVARWVCVPDANEPNAPNEPNVPTAGLISHWAFDETSGTIAADTSGNGHAGTLKGGMSFDNCSVPGQIGGALQFDGIDDYVYVPTIACPNGPLTFALWIKSLSELDAGDGIMELLHWGDPIQRPHLSFNRKADGKITLYVRIEGQIHNDVQTTTDSWQANTWYHVAVTFNGVDFKVYVDGELENTVGHPGMHASTSKLYIGSHRSGGSYWDGAMDEVAIYERALSEVEVRQLYDLGGSHGPLFVDAAGGNYLLKSERGRYWAEHDVWVLDDETSPCIDLGDPAVAPSGEPAPNGSRVNAGAYGNTPYASMSDWALPGDVNRDGLVNFLDVAIVGQWWLEGLPWMQ